MRAKLVEGVVICVPAKRFEIALLMRLSHQHHVKSLMFDGNILQLRRWRHWCSLRG